MTQVELPVIAPSLTDSLDGHVTKISNFLIFSCSIHSAWLNWREWNPASYVPGNIENMGNIENIEKYELRSDSPA